MATSVFLYFPCLPLGRLMEAEEEEEDEVAAEVGGALDRKRREPTASSTIDFGFTPSF
eukprot:m.188408 g.188408  ORF g.188408 m.188408 type:complete len:58 (+) comp25641_c0_seq5:87-260(+)